MCRLYRKESDNLSPSPRPSLSPAYEGTEPLVVPSSWPLDLSPAPMTIPLPPKDGDPLSNTRTWTRPTSTFQQFHPTPDRRTPQDTGEHLNVNGTQRSETTVILDWPKT